MKDEGDPWRTHFSRKPASTGRTYTEPLQLDPGSSLLHYRIAGLLGRGGMGAVYRAEDTKLGRDVAIKMLPPEFLNNEERLARFDREARLLAALNHPHIATIHGVEHVDGVRFIVMEHLTGDTLGGHLSRGPMPLDEAIAVAKQIAAALEAAHDKGVIHRDLKPGNIIIDDDGHVKVLDFGLAANIVSSDSAETEVLKSPTSPRIGTHTGVILGTAGYMSPEQARGKKADRRADVFSFGVVLYEMLTGRRLFAGETVSDTLAAVLKEEPNWSALPPETPPMLRRLLRRCLAKKPSERMRDFGDIRLELEDVGALPNVAPERVVEARRSIAPWIIAALAIVGAGLAFWRAAHATRPNRVVKTTVTNELDNAWNIAPAISPDGRRVAYSANGSLWIRDLDALEPRKIPLMGRRQPVLFWSPDSRWLVFISGGKIWKIAPEATAPVEIAALASANVSDRDTVFHSGAWGADDRIVLAGFREGLYELSARGGAITETLHADPDLVDFHNLSFLPDGKTLLGVPHGMNNRTTVEVIRGHDRQTVITFPNGVVVRGAAYSPSGHLLVSTQGNDAGLWAVPFSADKVAATGKPFLVLAAAGGCTASSENSLVYVANIDSAPRQLVRIDRKGNVTRIGEPLDSVQYPIVSHDERTVAVTARDADNHLSVSLIDLATGARRQLTRDAFEDRPQAWTHDDRQLLTVRDPNGKRRDPNFGLWLYVLDGSSEPRQIVRGADNGSLTPDEKDVMHLMMQARDTSAIYMSPLTGGQAVPLTNPVPAIGPAVLSPDGRFIAYAAGNLFIMSSDGKTRRQIATGGSFPVWGRDGKTLYFYASGKLMSVAAGDPAAKPALVLDPAPLNIGAAPFDVLSDGSIITVQDLPNEKRQVVLVQAWDAEFK